MIFHTVRVEPRQGLMGWSVSYTKSTVDRVDDVVTTPHPLGWYHYPSTMSDKEATRLLLRSMEVRHTEEIDKLTKSRRSLQDLLGIY